MMTTEIKELIKRLLKNKLISIQEVAMLQANKKEDRERLIELVQRLYNNGKVASGDVAVIFVEEEDALMLLEYINSESVSITPVTVIPEFPGVKTVPAPYAPNPWIAPNVPYINPQWPLPGRDNIIYCSYQNKMCTT